MKSKRIYIAGPLFSIHERQFLEEIVRKLSEKLQLDPNKDFFLPHRDAGDVGIAGKGRNDVFQDDINNLDAAKIVIALLDGPDVDSGTALELGYSYAKGKKIFGILTDPRKWNKLRIVGINNMVWGVCGEGKRIYRVEYVEKEKEFTIDSLVNEVKKVL